MASQTDQFADSIVLFDLNFLGKGFLDHEAFRNACLRIVEEVQFPIFDGQPIDFSIFIRMLFKPNEFPFIIRLVERVFGTPIDVVAVCTP